jgi:hypothetical protein
MTLLLAWVSVDPEKILAEQRWCTGFSRPKPKSIVMSCHEQS